MYFHRVALCKHTRLFSKYLFDFVLYTQVVVWYGARDSLPKRNKYIRWSLGITCSLESRVISYKFLKMYTYHHVQKTMNLFKIVSHEIPIWFSSISLQHTLFHWKFQIGKRCTQLNKYYSLILERKFR